MMDKDLQLYCNTRSKNYRFKDRRNLFNQTIYNYSQVLQKEHNCETYFITVTFPIDKNNRNIEKEWTNAGLFIEDFKKRLSKYYLVVGGILSVEPHKNTSLTSKRGKDTKAGSPHFHMVVWLCHQFLNPHIDRMGYALLLNGSFTKITPLINRMDVLKASVYTTKEGGSPIVNQLCKAFIKWPQNINIWSNHPETHYVFQNIEDSFPRHLDDKGQIDEQNNISFISKEFFNNFPTVRSHNDKALLLSELFAKVFAKQGLAVRNNHVFKRIKGTSYSWFKWISLESWIAQRFNFKAPSAYLQMLKDHALWISKQGAIKKNQTQFDIFPKLIIQGFFVEFKDYIYEFFEGKTIPLDSVPPNTATLCFENYTFDQCTPPFTLLGLLHTLVAWGKDITTERNEVQAIPTDQLQKYDIGRIELFQKSEDRFFEALQTFGGLYHPQDNRKQNPAIYLCGEPSTYKTFLLRTLFHRLIGIDSVDILSRHSGRFNTANLRKEEGENYILILDDLRWDNLGMHIPDFINLLDGYFVKTEEKYKNPQHGELKGTIAISSNEPIGGDIETSTIKKVDMKALETRLKNIQLHQIREEFVLTKTFLEQIEKEAVGFSIITNALYLQRNRDFHNESTDQIRIPKRFFQDEVDSNANLFEKAGLQHMINILKGFQQ